MADLDCFLRWYDVTGVCFDRASVTAQDLPYYASLARASRDITVPIGTPLTWAMSL